MNFNKTKTNKYIAYLEVKTDVFEKLRPSLSFEPRYYLEQYNINSLDTCVDWLKDNNEISYSSKTRLMDMCWHEFVFDIDMITINIIEYYKYFASTYWNKSNTIENSFIFTKIQGYYLLNASNWKNIIFHNNNIKQIIEN